MVAFALVVAVTALAMSARPQAEAGASVRSAAQGASPVASPAAAATGMMPVLPAGVAVEYLSNGVTDPAPGFVLDLVRITLDPGVTLPRFDHPGSALVYVDRGSVTVRVANGKTELLLADPQAFAPAVDPQGCATGCTLAAGDSLVLLNSSAQSFRNSSTGPVVLLVSELSPVGSGIRPMGCDRACRTMPTPTPAP